ncbi:hypothetical protein YC2023_054009 [Brassica napus]
MRQAEEHGEFEETALMMMQGRQEEPVRAQTQMSPPSAPRIPASQRLGPPMMETEAIEEEPNRTQMQRSPPGSLRISATQRLGTSTVETNVEFEEPARTETTIRKKPGRPPGRKTVQQSPKLIRGSSSRQRKTQTTDPPKVRRKLLPTGQKVKTTTRRTKPSGCHLHSLSQKNGSITAQKRTSATEKSGYIFLGCKLTGSGLTFLGRPWGAYSRVVFAYSFFSDVVAPQGWNEWRDPSKKDTVYYGEYKCYGPGADRTQRVKWSKQLSDDEATVFLSKDFIGGKDWLRPAPSHFKNAPKSNPT